MKHGFHQDSRRKVTRHPYRPDGKEVLEEMHQEAAVRCLLDMVREVIDLGTVDQNLY
jgi:hypothetical protein